MVYDSTIDSILNSFFSDDWDTLFEPNFKAPRIIKSMTNASFPQSNVYINKDTKEQKITVSLPGVSEKEVRLDRNDNVLELVVQRKADDSESNWAEIQSGFTSPERCRLSWKLDPSKYDLDSIDVKLENGLMTITIQPTEVAKPKRVAGLFGSLEDTKAKKLEDKKSE